MYSRIMIADFGVSNFVRDDEMLLAKAGSPGYLAPEVINQTGYGKSADIWSLGIITYNLYFYALFNDRLCGYHPFHYCQDKDQLFHAITRGKYIFDEPYWTKISEDAKDYIRWLLNLNPDSRPRADKAKLHPWIIKRCPEAEIYATKASGMSEHTIGVESIGGEFVAVPEDLELIEKALIQVNLQSKEEEEEEVNLASDVWKDGVFDARQKWRKAMVVVQTITRVNSTLKRGQNGDKLDSTYSEEESDKVTQ
jgi:hypothetical protein